MDWQQHIEQRSDIMYGKPVIKHTRVPVETILEKLAQGETMEGILEGYPHINRAAVQACLYYAFYAVKNEIIYALTD